MFSKLIKSVFSPLAPLAFLVALLLAPLAFVPARAVVTDPNRIIPERTCEYSQAVCYLRVTVNYNDPRISSSVWFDTLPANSYILAIDADVVTAFNAASTNVLTLGATAATHNEILASGITAGTPGIYHLTSAAGLGTLITANTTYQTALNGTVPVYVNYTQTGTAATTGQVVIVITFIKNNDK